jgi:5-formyltetrahydrofolate cyclo-ligase
MQEIKINLRGLFQNKRALISADDRQKAAEDAAWHMRKHVYFKQSQHIACYAASANEFDCKPLIEAIWQAHKLCYLPLLKETAAASLDFAVYAKGDSLQANRYAIQEPFVRAETKKIQPAQLDLVFAPLLAFDRTGHRLGMGGVF